MCENIKSMKKIVSLFIALSMFLGANGASERTSKISVYEHSGKVNQVLPGTPVKSAVKLHEATIARMEMAKNGQRVVRPAVKKAPRATASDITIEAENLQLDYYYGMFPYLTGNNDEYTVEAYFSYLLDVLYGTYTNNDEDLEIYIYDADDNEIALTYTTATYQKTARGDQFTAVGVGDNNNNYTINLTFFAPEQANDTIRYEFTTAQGDAFPEYGNYYIAAAEDDKFMCQIVFNGLVPTSSTAELDLANTWVQKVNGTDTTYVGAPYIADVLITETPTSYSFELSYFASDSNLYIMTLPVAKIAPVDTVVYTFAADRTINVLYYGETHDYYIKATDANAIVVLDIYSDDDFAGIWKATDGVFDFQYTGAAVITGADTTNLEYRDVEVIAIENEDDYDITANFFAKMDNKVYSFKTNYVKPTAKDTLEYTLVDYTFTDFRDYDGTFDIIAAPADSSVVFHLEFISEEIEDTFTEKDMSGDYTWVQVGKDYFNVVTAIFVITGDENQLEAVGQLLASNNTLYKLTIGSKTTSVERVEGATNIQPMKVIRGGQVLILKDGQYFNLLGTKVD